jgi:hypothetical protein
MQMSLKHVSLYLTTTGENIQQIQDLQPLVKTFSKFKPGENIKEIQALQPLVKTFSKFKPYNHW